MILFTWLDAFLGLEVKQSQNGIACNEHGSGNAVDDKLRKMIGQRQDPTELSCIESFRHACLSIPATLCHCDFLFGAVFQQVS
jgi:hypothetical protein